MKIRNLLVGASTLAIAVTGLGVGMASSAHATAPPCSSGKVPGDPCLPANGAKPPARDVSHDNAYCDSLVGAIKFTVPLTLSGSTANTIGIKAALDGCTDTTAGVYDPSFATTATTEGVILGPAKLSGTLFSNNNDCLGLSGLSASTSGDTTVSWTSVTKIPNPNYSSTDPDQSPSDNPQTVGAPKIFSDGPGGGTKAVTTFTIAQTYGGTYTPAGTASDASLDPSGTAVAWSANSSGYGMFQIGTDAAHHGTAAPSAVGAFRGNDNGATGTFDGTTGQSQASLAAACFGKGIKGINFGNGQVTFQ